MLIAGGVLAQTIAVKFARDTPNTEGKPADWIVESRETNALPPGFTRLMTNWQEFHAHVDLVRPQMTAWSSNQAVLNAVALAQAQTIAEAGRFRSGTTTTALVDGTAKTVAFDVPTLDTNYVVFIQPNFGTALTMWPANRTTNGFILNLSVAVSGSFSYLAILK